MIRVHIFCEGQTEETFVRELLYAHFLHLNILLNPIVIRTGKFGKGGVTSYAKLKHQITRKCQEDSTAWVTTMVDFYGFPPDVSGYNQITSGMDSFSSALLLERLFQQDIGHNQFIANLLIHEFEGLLFSAPSAFDNWFDPSVGSVLQQERSLFTSPEHINDHHLTAPSKRILNHCPGYRKITHGSLIVLDIGLNKIRLSCPHFNSWLLHLEQLVEHQ